MKLGALNNVLLAVLSFQGKKIYILSYIIGKKIMWIFIKKEIKSWESVCVCISAKKVKVDITYTNTQRAYILVYTWWWYIDIC